MKVLILALLTIAFLGSFLLARAVKTLPLVELRRRARGGQDKQTHAIYKAAAYGVSFDLLVWLVGSLSTAGLIILVAASAWWLGVLTVLLIGWLIMFVQVDTDRWTWAISARLAPLAAKLAALMQPLLSRPAKLLKKHQPKAHTKIFEKQDLLDSLQQQNRQADNRLSQPEINVVSGALSFGDKTVGSVMTPRKSVKLVAASDPIGPHLMDELHASGFRRLPVAKELNRSATPEIVGTLYLKDLIGHPSKGRVRDVMKSEVYFVNEEQNLRQALGVFLTTQCHLLVVVNNFEEFVGVLSMEDVMEQILGAKIMDEFEQYSERRAVAALDAKAAQSEHSSSEMVE